MSQAGCLDAGHHHRGVATDAEAVALVVLLPTKVTNDVLAILVLLHIRVTKTLEP